MRLPPAPRFNFSALPFSPGRRLLRAALVLVFALGCGTVTPRRVSAETAPAPVPATGAASSTVTVNGRVFLDANANGQWEPGEKGVAGCLVSDERAFARTDTEGHYRLEASGEPLVVFAVNPPGTWPAGPWWHALPGGAAAQTADFPLQSQDQSGPLVFVQGTDPHLHPAAVPQFRRYVEHVNSLPLPVKFVVHTGDLVIDASMATMERARELFSLYETETRALRPPLRNVMGNHDVAGLLHPKLNGDEPGIGKALYRERAGPATYAFRFGPYHFIALDATLLEERKLSYGLTRASADWAIRYLAEVAAGEPLVLLVHEPLFPEVAGVRQPDTPDSRPHEPRLRDALRGHKLLLTLAGHVHSRGRTEWAGAPHLIGGAISYAWHGILPFPPAPCGYVLHRLEGDRVEHVFLDWAEERSIDLASPAFAGLAQGPVMPVRGVVADFAGEVTAVDCELRGQRAHAVLTRRGALATAFEAMLDTSALADGACDLLVTARAGARRWTERQPVIVINGRPAAFAPAGGATLTFAAEGHLAGPLEVACNGHPLAVTAELPAGMRCEIPSAHLRRLNEIVVRGAAASGAKSGGVVKKVALAYDGRRYRDVRFSPLARRSLGSPVVSWIDLSYPEP